MEVEVMLLIKILVEVARMERHVAQAAWLVLALLVNVRERQTVQGLHLHAEVLILVQAVHVVAIIIVHIARRVEMLQLELQKVHIVVAVQQFRRVTIQRKVVVVLIITLILLQEVAVIRRVGVPVLHLVVVTLQVVAVPVHVLVAVHLQEVVAGGRIQRKV